MPVFSAKFDDELEELQVRIHWPRTGAPSPVDFQTNAVEATIGSRSTPVDCPPIPASFQSAC